jgi:hypothetical protein
VSGIGETDPRLPILCYCGRRLGFAQVDPAEERVIIAGITPRADLLAIVGGRRHPLKPTSIIRPDSAWPGGQSYTQTFFGHSRCKARPVITERRLTKAFVRAARDGRGDLRFGDNL